MLSQLGTIVARRFHELTGSIGLDPKHFALMSMIDSLRGQSQNAVAERLHIPPSSMVALIDHLEHLGWVIRRPHPTDRRTRTLQVTAAGQAVLDQARTLAMALEAEICRGLSGDERESLLEQLGRVASNLAATPGVHPGLASSCEVEPGELAETQRREDSSLA